MLSLLGSVDSLPRLDYAIVSDIAVNQPAALAAETAWAIVGAEIASIN